MKSIQIAVNDKIATRTNDVEYVCGNSDFVVDFTFDAEWNEFDTKTARFAYNGEHQDVIFEGAQCPVPIIYGVRMLGSASTQETFTRPRLPMYQHGNQSYVTVAFPPILLRTFMLRLSIW